MSLYEGMFILDNQAVRVDWRAAKSTVTTTLEKHGAAVRTARRWDERRLAYPIKHRLRGTYVLAYYDIEAPSISALRRDLELSETVLRYLLIRTDEVPADEIEKAAAEDQEGYAPPAPPEDDEPEPRGEPRAEEKEQDKDEEDEGDDEDESSESKGEGNDEAAEKAESAEKNEEA